MSRIWLTSDYHFNHDREFIWKARGFDSVEQMNEWIIFRHNELVQPDDDVYVLGDLMLGDSVKGIECVRRLNGKLHIVRGNHDTDRRWELYTDLRNVAEMQNAIYIKYKKHHFYLSHYPTLTGNLEKESLTQMTLNLYGHTHQKDNFYMDMPYMYHVGVDSHNCKPVLLDNIIEEMHQKVEECKQFLDLEEEDSDNNTMTRSDFYNHYCDKCVWYGIYDCLGPQFFDEINTYNCPSNYIYKRDPPDGGYYG